MSEEREGQKKKSSIGSIIKTISSLAMIGFIGFVGFNMYQNMKPPTFPGYATKVYKKPEKVVALIPINRTIYNASSAKTVSSDTIISLINKAENKGVSAYIFEINSGGGTVLASKEIMEKVKEVSQKKFTVALIRDIGASGAYWIASACDNIVADETSLVGSIGVRMNYLQFQGLMHKLGIKNEEIKAGNYKTSGSPYKKLTSEERKILENIIQESYDLFVNSVAKNRNMKLEKVKKLATGQIYTGKMGLENGLIDYLGGRKEVANMVQNELKTGYKLTVYYSKPPQSLLGGLLSKLGHSIGTGIADNFQEQNNKLLMEHKNNWQ